MNLKTQPIAPSANDILLALPARAEATRAARQALRRRGVHPDLDHTVSLLTSEIVGNAVRHAAVRSGQRIIFYARLHADHARVEVADPGPGFDPEVRHATPGFGLRLLDKLSSRWGVEVGETGCRVWFEVDRRPRRFPRPAAAAA